MTEKELQHEINMSRAATDAIRRGVDKAMDKNYFSSTDFGRDFASKYTIPFGDALIEATGKTARGRVTVTNIAKTYKSMQTIFSLVDKNVIAAIALKSILDSLGVCKYDKPRTAEAAGLIGRNIEDQVRVNYYTQLAPDAVVSVQNKELSTKVSNPHHRRYGAKRAAEKMLLDMGWNQDELYPSWSSELKKRVGLFVIEVAKKLGWVVQEKRYVAKNKTQGFIDLSPEIHAAFAHYQAALEAYSVMSWPLIEVPRDWQLEEGASRNNFSGGYYHEWIRRQYRLCRSYNSDTEFGREAIDLLNRLNKTAWNIDHDLLHIAQSCLEKGFSIGSLNAVFRDPRLVQDMPKEIEELPVWDLKRVAWRKERSLLHHALAESKRKSVRSRDAIHLASQFLKQPRFYLSWSCDYRGRMYTQQALLHRQSSDVEKSLVTFADGCKLDKRGEYWAGQAIGSAFLGSKYGYEDRHRWTLENKELLKAIADDPISQSCHWEGADEPWQFLQLCLEWNRVVLTKEKHLWDVPIGADASASGLQLLSAMRRDEKGMEWSNLYAAESSSEPPKDAYREVLRIACELAKKSPDTVWMIEYLSNRSLGKAILMKKVYGAELSTNRTDVKVALIEDGYYPDPFTYKDVNTLTKIISVASELVFPKAFESLEWIKELYKAAKKNGRTSLTWTTPNQDSVHLIENKVKTIDIRTSHLGQVRIGTEQGDTPDFHRMKNALAPSFVHSYDAAVLKSSFKDWTHPLAVIHDCINVLPNDMERAMARMKHGFVHVCSGDPLGRLADDLGVPQEQLKRLSMGDGRIDAVLDSTYMIN